LLLWDKGSLCWPFYAAHGVISLKYQNTAYLIELPKQLQPRSAGLFVADAVCGTAAAKSGCIPMNKNTITKATKTAEELTAALNKAIQAHPECQGIKLFKLTALADSHGIANWDAEWSPARGLLPLRYSRRACATGTKETYGGKKSGSVEMPEDHSPSCKGGRLEGRGAANLPAGQPLDRGHAFQRITVPLQTWRPIDLQLAAPGK
jgi:hypothetical protein